MQKKSKNRLLFSVLLISILLFLVLILLLKLDKILNPKQENNGNQEEYYLPTVSTKRVAITFGEEVTPEMFIQSVDSIYEVSYCFEKAPDLSRYGTQEVIILVTDAMGNSAAVREHLVIINLKEQLEVNLGSSLPEAEDFLIEAGSEISFVTDISQIDTGIPASYSIFFMVDGVYAQSVLSIDDYEAPNVITRNVEAWLNHPQAVERFIVSAEDNSTEVELSYQTEPDWSIAGEQTVYIIASDKKGNIAEYSATLTLLQDTVPPVVSAGNLDVCAGSVISYRKAVNSYDNASPAEELTLEVDNSKVNLNEVGSYEVTYTVTDFAGNSTSVVALVNVVEEAPLWNDEAFLQEKAQNVLDSILEEDMSAYEKAEAVFYWVNQNIRFINFSEKDNYARGAYEGLVLQEGDCFVYAATSKYLLNLAGIQNLDIKKSSTNPVHYWNLVYMEDGWYHFDACPNKEGVRIFLFTDAQLKDFSASRGNSHTYDSSLYPVIK